MKLLDRNFLIRAASGAAFVVIVVGATLFSPYTFLALMLAVMAGSMWEFHRLAVKAGLKPLKWFPIITGALVLASVMSLNEWGWSGAGTAFSLAYTGYMFLISLVVIIPLVPIIELYRKSENPIANIGATYTSMLYIVLPLALMTAISTIGGGYDGWRILYFLFILWANDIGAYIFGVMLGRHRLFERISPKKSWEGFFGGVAMAAGVAALIGGVIVGQNIVLWIALGVVIAVTGLLGDLVESMFKRAVGVKDSGSIMPGHGGFLDRFDAMFISAPFVFLFYFLSGL